MLQKISFKFESPLFNEYLGFWFYLVFSFFHFNYINTTYVSAFFIFKRKDSHFIFKYQRNEWKIVNMKPKNILCSVLSSILCIHIFYHIKMNNFHSKHILLKFMIFRAKVTIELKKFKCIEKMNFTYLNFFFSFNNQY